MFLRVFLWSKFICFQLVMKWFSSLMRITWGMFWHCKPLVLAWCFLSIRFNSSGDFFTVCRSDSRSATQENFQHLNFRSNGILLTTEHVEVPAGSLNEHRRSCHGNERLTKKEQKVAEKTARIRQRIVHPCLPSYGFFLLFVTIVSTRYNAV